MKKFKCFLAALLSVSMMTSAAVFTACGNNGDNDNAKLTPGQQVANEEEWEQAFDKLFTFDNFTVKMTGENHISGSTANSNTYVDLKDSKFYHNHTALSPKLEMVSHFQFYYEISDDVLCAYNSSNDEESEINFYTNTDNENINDEFRLEILYSSVLQYLYLQMFVPDEDAVELYSCKDMYSNFKYVDGFYVIDNLYYIGVVCSFKISISNGYISGAEMKIESYKISEQHSITYTFSITNVNSTTVTAPEDVRAAIDAEKAKK